MSCSSPSRKGSSQQPVASPGRNWDKTLTTGYDSCHLHIYMQLNYSALIDAFLRHSPVVGKAPRGHWRSVVVKPVVGIQLAAGPPVEDIAMIRAVSPQAWVPSQSAVQAKLAAAGSGVQRAWLQIPKGDA